MNQYLNAGIVLMLISLGGFMFLLTQILLLADLVMIYKRNFFSYIAQFAASLVSGTLGGFFIGKHKGLQGKPVATVPQDSSVHE